MRYSDLLGQASAERVGARNNDAIVDPEFEEGVADGANLGEEVLVRHRDLAVLVAALLFVGHLVFDLQRAGACLDHLLGQQVSRLGVTETGVDVRDDRHDMRLEVVDLVLDVAFLDGVAVLACLVELPEQAAEFASVSLPQERVQFFDQRRHRGLLVHRLIGQRAEFGAQGSDHPSREIQVATVGRAEVFLDRNHLLLADKAVPASQRLRVLRRIGVVSRHVLAHDFRRVTRDIEASLEAILRSHARYAFRIDSVPGASVAGDYAGGGLDVVRILRHEIPLVHRLPCGPVDTRSDKSTRPSEEFHKRNLTV